MSSFEQIKGFDYKQFLADCGVRADFNNDSVVIFDYSLLPSIAYIRTEGVFRIYYYPHNKDSFGQQSFEFDFNAFSFAANKSKFKRNTPSVDYTSFEFLFFDSFYSKANNTVRAIFQLYEVNRTVLINLSRERKTRNRRLKMSLKTGVVRKVLGLTNKKQTAHLQSEQFVGENSVGENSVGNPHRKKYSSLNNLHFSDSDIYNMSLAVKNAATKYDLSFFSFYLDSFLNALGKKSVGKILYNKIYQKFLSEVDKLQKI